MFDKFLLALGSGLYLGFLSPRTATVGALLGLPLTDLLMWVSSGLTSPALAWGVYSAITAFLCLAGVPICQRSAVLIGRHDPREVVFDEIATMPIVFLFVNELSWPVLLAGFLLHRLFDISKVLGASRLQFLPGGWGIMADDILAAAYACGSLHLLLWSGIFEQVGG